MVITLKHMREPVVRHSELGAAHRRRVDHLRQTHGLGPYRKLIRALAAMPPAAQSQKQPVSDYRGALARWGCGSDQIRHTMNNSYPRRGRLIIPGGMCRFWFAAGGK